jgi:SAM-dependent methyltransferase
MVLIFLLAGLAVIYVLIGSILAFREFLGAKKPGRANSGDRTVDPVIYDADYYLDAFSKDENTYIASLSNLPISLGRCFDIAGIKEGERILDLGCGRGELAYYCVLRGCHATALDYSSDAVNLARRTRDSLPQKLRPKMEVLHMDFADLNESYKFDVIFMADLVEHLYDVQLKKLFEKTKRILRPGSGRIVIHTAPNRLFINVIFPLKRILNWPQILQKKKSFFYTRGKYCYDLAMHVNEQTPASLKKHLRGFNFKVWCDDGSANIISLMTKKFAGADIWALAKVS